MKARAFPLLAALALYGCGDEQRAATHATPPAAGTIATTAARPGTVPGTTDARHPSYEVTIASAQADRVHALNACDDKQGAARAACVREADRVYDQAREAAEKIRGSER